MKKGPADRRPIPSEARDNHPSKRSSQIGRKAHEKTRSQDKPSLASGLSIRIVSGLNPMSMEP